MFKVEATEEPQGDTPHDAQVYPRIRARRSLATPIWAFVLMIIVLSGFSAAFIANKSRALRAEFDLLTSIYVPLGVRLSAAHAGSAKIGARIEALSTGGPSAMAALDDPSILVFAEALERREALVEELGGPIREAMTKLDEERNGSKFAGLRLLASQVEQLEQVVHVDAGREVMEVLLDTRRQYEINNRFRSLQELMSKLVLEQREAVENYSRQTERLIAITTTISMVLSIVVALVVGLTLRPLQRLSEGVRELGRGERNQRVKLKDSDPVHDDEVSRLAREFNLMADALQERERRLVASERLAAVGQLVAQVTHEIRNPLSSVALNFELLEDEFTSSEGDAQKIIQSIGTELERLSQITETYLDFVRRPQPSRHPTDLREEIVDLAAFLRLEFEQAGVTLEVREGVDLCWAAIDADQIRRMLINLLRNAREAAAGLEDALASRTAKVWVAVTARDDQVCIEVGDTGPGLPPEIEDTGQIFDAFFTQKAKGTGLGLAVVRQVVEAHGGSVEVAQTGSEGTIFKVLLPACDP